MSLNPDHLVELSEARLYIKRNIGADTDDDTLEQLIDAYSPAVNRYCERQFQPEETNVAHTFAYRGNGYLSLAPYDLQAATLVRLLGQGITPLTLTTAEYNLEPAGRTSEGTYLYLTIYPGIITVAPLFGSYRVEVTGDWGVPSVPGDVAMATLIAVADGYRNPEGAGARTLGELNYQEVPEAGDVAGRSLPPDARALLSPYRRVAV